MLTSFVNCRACATFASVSCSDGPRRNLAWDGVGELWFDSIAQAEQAFRTEPFRSQLAEDRKKFVGEVQWCYVEEHTGVGPL